MVGRNTGNNTKEKLQETGEKYYWVVSRVKSLCKAVKGAMSKAKIEKYI